MALQAEPLISGFEIARPFCHWAYLCGGEPDPTEACVKRIGGDSGNRTAPLAMVLRPGSLASDLIQSHVRPTEGNTVRKRMD
jgi:hypothetical protein